MALEKLLDAVLDPLVPCPLLASPFMFALAGSGARGAAATGVCPPLLLLLLLSPLVLVFIFGCRWCEDTLDVALSDSPFSSKLGALSLSLSLQGVADTAVQLQFRRANSRTCSSFAGKGSPEELFHRSLAVRDQPQGQGDDSPGKTKSKQFTTVALPSPASSFLFFPRRPAKRPLPNPPYTVH